MTSISVYHQPANSSLQGSVVVSRSPRKSCPPPAFAFKSVFLGKRPVLLSANNTRPGSAVRPADFSRRSPITASSQSHTFDVVVIGAGIIGLTIARQLLVGSDLSVAVVDKAVPCSGATGAGQGYIWMVHRIPGSEIWDMSMRSNTLWRMFAESLCDQGLDPLQELGWKQTGSLLIGRTSGELITLKERVKQLSKAGLKAEYFSRSDLLPAEPALMAGEDSGAVFLADDCQLDAMRTVAYIEKGNRHFASKGRYMEFYHDPVTRLLRSNSTGEVEAVQTSKNTLYSKKAIVVAAGCWSGSLMHDLLRETEIVLDVPVKPRKGHLVVLENFNSIKLNHASMEAGYVAHHDLTLQPGQVDHGERLSISMTATTDAAGNLVLGSSRQFAGFNTEVDEMIIDCIWKRAGEFYPKLRDLSLADFISNRKVRIGLRPYMPDGKPIIGSVPGLSNVFLATGHEGLGLSLAWGTAEMVADMVLQNPLKVDSAPFVVQGRCC